MLVFLVIVAAFGILKLGGLCELPEEAARRITPEGQVVVLSKLALIFYACFDDRKEGWVALQNGFERTRDLVYGHGVASSRQRFFLQDVRLFLKVVV